MPKRHQTRQRGGRTTTTNKTPALPTLYRYIGGFLILWAICTISFIHVWAPRPNDNDSSSLMDENNAADGRLLKRRTAHHPKSNLLIASEEKILSNNNNKLKKKGTSLYKRKKNKKKWLEADDQGGYGGGLKKKKRIVFVIPYRHERPYKLFLEHLKKVHKERKKEWDMHVYTITENADHNQQHHFRRAWLLNAGIKEIVRQGLFTPNNETCLATFGTDIVPSLVTADYGWCDKPTLLCSELSCFNNGLPYPEYISGGVITAKLDDWIKVNGYTDSAYDWDGEDEELFLRFKLSGLLQKQQQSNGTTAVLRHPPRGQGRCECLAPDPSDRLDRPFVEQARVADHLMRLSIKKSQEWRYEGLSTVSYQVVKEDHPVINDKSGFSTTWLHVREPEPVIDNPLAPPNNKTSSTDHRQQVVLVIPYRDRRVHYEKMMAHLKRLRTKVGRMWNIHVFVIEQMNNDYFRKGWLSNVGFHEVAKRFPHRFTCVVQHDVDLFPNLDTVSYGWCDEPTQVCTEIPCFGYHVPYLSFTGGVLSLRLDHWIQVNGYTNKIWGWGGEDDDLRYRLLANDLMQDNRALRRPPGGEGYCDCLDDVDHDKREKDPLLYEAIQDRLDIFIKNANNFTGWKDDGFSTTNYKIVNNFVDNHGTVWFQVNYTSEQDWSSWFIKQYASEMTKNHILSDDPLYQKDKWDRSPIVLEDYRLIFYTIPKLGSTVFKQLFRRMMGYKDWQLSNEKNGLKYLYDYPLEQANAMMTDPNYTRAIFVRDPKVRFLEAYLDKAVNNSFNYVDKQCCQSDMQNSHLCQNQAYAGSLGSFLSLCMHCSDPQWEPQSARMLRKHWRYINFVGHLENAANDTRRLLNDLGVWDEFGKSGWGKYGNESIFASISTFDHATRETRQLKKYYTTRDIEKRVEVAYATDYELPILNFTNYKIFANRS